MSGFFRIFPGVLYLRFAGFVLKFNQFKQNSVHNCKSQKIFHSRAFIYSRITSTLEPNRKMSTCDGKSDCSSSDEEINDWRGCTMEEIHRHLNEFELEHLPPVHPSDTHTVLHQYPIRSSVDDPPRPLRGHHKWDAYHVRLPCSSKSQYPVTGEDGNVTIDSRWEMIEKALLRPIANSHELEEAILVYNSRYKDQWHFVALHKLFEEELDESESRVFFEDLLPRIIRLALRLPELVQSAVPLLKQGQSHSLTLTQEQISCLLANGFLCTYPRRNTMKRKSEYSTFPDINFNRLFQSTGHQVLEKIKCICHYFRRVCPTEQSNRNVPTGVVTFTRRSLHYSDMPNWSECMIPLSSTLLHITSSGTIEDQGLGLLQVDFANKFLGGGVLGRGCVQEEIRFVICPELLISKLFTECLRPTEALLMVGCERYSNYTGYAGSFQWAGNHEDMTPRDSSRRRQTHIVAIDALAFVQSSHQYREELMLRELNKAYVGFYHPLETPAPGVASGNWGCGAFGGEVTLKALIQLMACAVNKRPLAYFTFGNSQLRDEVYKLHTFLGEQQVRVCDLWATLKRFHNQKTDANQLYQFIYSCHSKKGIKTQPICNEAEDRSQTEKASMTRNNLKNSTGSITHPIVNDSTSISASTSKIDAKMQQRNIGSYFVAISSDCSSSDQHSSVWKEEIPSNNLPSTEPQTPKSILILGDSATDNCSVIPAAVVENSSHERSQNGKSLIPNTSPTSTVEKRSQPRQRTLIEMLENSYTDGNQAKRSKN